MKRLAEQRIRAWKDAPRRKPLIIRGARQVGKTWLVENDLADEFDSFVKIDLEKRRDLHRHFEGNLDPQAIVTYLELEGIRIIPGQTLLFFDEIQACPRAVMALRYFYEQMPGLHVVAAGSLLEFVFGDISIPVGRVQYLHLVPMTFYEYLLALGKDVMAEYLLQDPATVDGQIQMSILQELRHYFFVGGMPECVKTYRDTRSLFETFRVQSDILDAYRDDFSKYTPRIDTTCLDTVFLSVAMSIGDQLKYTRLNAGHSSQTILCCFKVVATGKGTELDGGMVA